MRRTAPALATSIAMILITGSSLIAQNDDPFGGLRNLFRRGGNQPAAVTNAQRNATPLQLDPIPVGTSKSAEILRLLYANQRTEAIEQSAAHLTELVEPFLQIDPSKRGPYDAEVNFGPFASVYGLTEDVLAKLKPGEGDSEQAHIAYAAGAEMLKDTERALQAYQAALEITPDHDGIRHKLVLLAIESGNQPLALKVLTGISTPSLGLLAQELSNRVQNTSENKYSRRLDYFEVLAVTFEQADPSTYILADGLTMLLDNYIGQANYGNEIRFRDLYSTSTGGPGYNNDKQEAASRLVETRREALHEKLCRALIKLPQLSTIGFQRLSGLATKDESKLPEFKKLAQTLLLARTSVPERPASLPPNPHANYSNFRQGWVPFLSPAEFLLSVSVKDGNTSPLTGKVIPALKAANQAKTAEFLEEMLELAAAADSDFAAQAALIIKTGYPDVAISNLMRRVMEMVESRQTEIDTRPVFMAYFEAIREELYQSPEFVASYGQTQASMGAESFSKFIDEVAVAMLGPVEGHAALIEQHYQPNNSDPTSPGNPIRNYAGFLGQMIQSPAMAAIPLKKAAAMKLLSQSEYQIRNGVQNNLQSYRMRNRAGEVFTFIKEMGFLNDVETFDFFPMINISRNSMFGYLLYNLGRLGSDDKQTVLTLVEAESKKSFGRSLLMASMNASSGTSSQRTAITMALEPYMDRILKLPEERQKALRYGYAQYISMNSLSSSLKRSAPKVEAWYGPARNDGSLQRTNQNRMGSNQGVPSIAAFLKSTSRHAFDQNNGLEFVAGQVLQKLPPNAKRDELSPLITHYLKLARQPYAHAPSVKTEPQLGSILTQWLNNGASPDKLGLVVQCYALEGNTSKPYGTSITQALRSILTQIDFGDPDAAASSFHQGSGDRYDARMTPHFLERFATLQPNSMKAIQSWAAGQTSDLAKAWGSCAALALAATSETQAPWITLLKDDAQSLDLRMEAAAIVAPVACGLKAWPLVETALARYKQAWDSKDVSVPSQLAYPLLVRLLKGENPSADQARLAKQFLEAWTPHLDKTGMGLALVQNVLACDASYGIDAATWLRDLPQSVQRQPGFFIMVLQNGTPEQAAAALPWAFVSMPPLPPGTNNRSQRVVRYINGQRQEYYTSSNPGNGQSSLGNAQMDRALWDQLQALLPEVEDPGARYYAELVVGGLPDRAAEEGVPIRRERLAAINDRYDRGLFSSPDLAEHSLSWLCSLNGITDHTRPSVIHFGDQLDYGRLAKWNDVTLSASRQAMLGNYVKDASKNNPSGFARLLTSMLAEADPQRGEAQQLLETYCKGFPKSVFKDAAQIDSGQASSYLPLLKTLGEMSNNVYWNGRDECLVGNVAMHVLAGQGQAYQDWLSGLDDINTMGNIVSQTSLQQVVFLLRDRFQDKELPEATRTKMLNDLFVATTIPQEAKNYVSSSNRSPVYEQMIDLNALTVEEILKYGPKWAEMNPRQGAAYGELAGYQAKAGQRDEAILNYLQAVVHAPRNEREGYTRFHIEKTKLLLESDRVDAAAAWIDFFDEGRLDSEFKSEFKRVAKQSRQRYLTSPKHLDQSLSETRSMLHQNPRHAESWEALAETLGAVGSARMDQSDYIKGLAFLKLSFYVFHQLDRAKIKYDKSLFTQTKQDLARGMLALGLGGKREIIIAKRKQWHYHYQHGGLSDSKWKYLTYKFSTDWKEGVAPFGCGNKIETTTLNYGADKDNKPITAYFRKTFKVEEPADFDELSIKVLHDDGVRVYLNGSLLVQNNMPQPPITPLSQAPESRGSSDENKYWAKTFKAERLKRGTNVITAEVHQNDPDSSDLGFDLEISAEAVSSSEIVEEVESGKVLKRLKLWEPKLPEGLVPALQSL